MSIQKPVPRRGRDGFDAQVYQQEIPNEAGKAYLTFTNTHRETQGENQTFVLYEFKLHEKNGVGFAISSIELKAESARGNVRTETYAPSDFISYGSTTDIAPYGEWSFTGGFPKGEYLRVGIIVHGNDANGEPMIFYSMIEL